MQRDDEDRMGRMKRMGYAIPSILFILSKSLGGR